MTPSATATSHTLRAPKFTRVSGRASWRYREKELPSVVRIDGPFTEMMAVNAEAGWTQQVGKLGRLLAG